MSSLLIGLLSAVVATNTTVAVSNLITQATGLTVNVPGADDPVEKEYQKLLDDDDAAHEEVDGWIRENAEFAEKGGGIPPNDMKRRVLKRLEPIQSGYENFIKRHPDHAKARVAFASYLEGMGDEDGSKEQLEVARKLDPNDAAIWNNLANYYGEHGPTTNAFVYYEKAISLDPREPVYFHNFGTMVCMYRKDAKEYFKLNEQQVFDKSLVLYSNAMRLDPTNFLLAADVAETYYLIKPLRTNDALQSWTNALKLAQEPVEREGVYLHLARIKLAAGKFPESHTHLNAVTNPIYGELKRRLTRNLQEKEFGTNLPPASSATNTVSAPAPPAKAAEQK